MKYNLETIADFTVPECLNEFLNYLSTIRGKSPNTIRGYKADLIMFFRFLKLYKGLCSKDTDFENIRIDDVNTAFLRGIRLSDLYAFISFAEVQRANGSYAKARKVATLKSFFKYISGKARLVDENPALELESPKINKRNPVYLTFDESKTLLHSMDPSDRNYERDYCIITLFLNCGLRLSELCGINVSKIRGDILTVIGKGNKERTVYLNKACLKAINQYLIFRNSKYGELQPESKDALFLSERKQRLDKRQVERIVKKYVTEAGLQNKKYTPHKLRHTAATLMYKHGKVDIRSLQQILGHENISTTQIYTHVDDEKLREAVSLNPLSEE